MYLIRVFIFLSHIKIALIKEMVYFKNLILHEETFTTGRSASSIGIVNDTFFVNSAKPLIPSMVPQSASVRYTRTIFLSFSVVHLKEITIRFFARDFFDYLAFKSL